MASKRVPGAALMRQFQARRERMLARASRRPIVLFALGIVAFNAWDRWIDPAHADTALVVRLVTAACLLPCYLLQGRGLADRHAKYLHGAVFLIGIIGVAIASASLTDGFLWGAAGTLAFPMILAFYSIPQRFYIALNLVALGIICALIPRMGVSSAHLLNFVLMYALMIWVGSTAARVLRHQQLRAFVLEVKHAEDARTDALTGLFNRRHIEELGRRSIELVRRHEEKPIALLMIDVDHFKLVNDRHGHDQGDRALKRVAIALRAQLRSGDLLGRWGGEEFLAIINGASAAIALEVAQRAVIALRNDSPDDDAPLTVSIGVAAHADGGDWEALVKRADAALYRAKAEGRDRAISG